MPASASQSNLTHARWGDIGAHVKSSDVTLQPGTLIFKDCVADTGTAGSCTLLVQAVLPCLLRAKSPAAPHTPAQSSIQLLGGTDVAFSPPVDYLVHVLLPTLRRVLGFEVDITVERRGFFPKGGGKLTLLAKALPAGKGIPPICIEERGEICGIDVYGFFTANSAKPAMQGTVDDAIRRIQGSIGDKIEIRLHLVQETKKNKQTAFGDGAGMLLVAHTTSGCILAGSGQVDKGVKVHEIGKKAAEELLRAVTTGVCVDEHLQDQLVVFMAMARGTSRVVIGEPSSHTHTAICIAETLTTAKFQLTRHSAFTSNSQGQSQLWLLECQGGNM